MTTTLSRIESSSSPCVPSTSIYDLPEDVLLEILFKLPFKDINLCKYISKLWNFLISKVCVPRIASDPVYSMIFSEEDGEQSFAYIRSSNDHHKREISFEESGLDTAALPFHPSPHDFQDCHNGLFLYFVESSMQYYLCNPCTHQYISIPIPPGELEYKRTALIFDSHYKLVNIDGSTQPKLNIFSLVTRQWSVHNRGPEISFHGRTWDPYYIFLDGSLYKLCVAHYVLKINLNNPIDCQEIRVPGFGMRLKIGCIGVSQGELHYGYCFCHLLQVWTLKTGSNGCPDEWITKYWFFLSDNLYENGHHRILGFHPTTDEFIICNTQGLFFYEPKTKEFEVICVFSRKKVLPSLEYLVYLFSPNITRLEELLGKDQNLHQ